MRHAKKLQISYRSIDELKPFPKNPRLHSRQQIAQIARSIEEFSFNIPIIVDAEGTVICGHGRLLAAQKLGWREVPTACLDHLSRAQVLAFRIADNKLTENARWDDELLTENLREISIASPDLDLEITGFETPEIDLLLGEVPKPARASDPGDVLPPISDTPAICRQYDVWNLGRHRLIVGNALEPSVFSGLMNGRLAAAVCGPALQCLRRTRSSLEAASSGSAVPITHRPSVTPRSSRIRFKAGRRISSHTCFRRASIDRSTMS